MRLAIRIVVCCHQLQLLLVCRIIDTQTRSIDGLINIKQVFLLYQLGSLVKL